MGGSCRQRVAFVEASLSGSGFHAMRHARELGCEVLFLTRATDYYASRCGVGRDDIAELGEILHSETNDVEAVVRTLTHSGGVDAVLSAGEHHVDIAAAVATRLGVRGLGRDAGRIARNKRLAAECFSAAGIRIPRFLAVRSAEDVAGAEAVVGYPLVVKPVDGTASTGVRYCRSVDEAREQVAALLGRGRHPRGRPYVQEVLLTEYVPGAEVSVETLTAAGVTEVLGITAKRVGPLPYFVEIGHTFPAPLPPEQEAACAALARSALRALGLNRGAAHIEMRLTGEGPTLLEVNARPAGDHITTLIRLAAGLDPLREWVRLHLDDHAPRPWGRTGRAASIRYFTPPAGLVTEVGGPSSVAGLPWVHEVNLRVRPGDRVGPLRESHDRCGHVITTAHTPDDALRRAEHVHDAVRIGIRPIAKEIA